MTYCIMCRSVADGQDPHPMGVLAMSIMLKLCADHQKQARETLQIAMGDLDECTGDCGCHTPSCGHPDYCCAACPELPQRGTPR